MTTQQTEVLLWKRKRWWLKQTPLWDFFQLVGETPSFGVPDTTLWRGYIGTWEIVDRRLYLINLEGLMLDRTPASMATIFPRYPERAFADWYCGPLEIEFYPTDVDRARMPDAIRLTHKLMVERGILVEGDFEDTEAFFELNQSNTFAQKSPR